VPVNVALHNEWFCCFCFQTVLVTVWCKASLLFDAISDHEMYSRYSNHMMLLSYDKLQQLINFVCIGDL
jgi:hypothetical protein